MGQGCYTVIAFGAIYDFDDGNDGGNLYDWVHQAAEEHGVQGRKRYEARQSWFGFFIAENGAGVSRNGDGCEIFDHEVFDAATLASAARDMWPKQFHKCCDAYDSLVGISKQHGVQLPAGRLLLVNDYD
jgi:hypothetical protein